MGILPFIEHSNTQEIIAQLETAWTAAPEDRLIVPILGYEGTGKKRLLDHWVTEYRRTVSGAAYAHAPIVCAGIRESDRVKPKKGTYTTAVTCNLFSEIVFALGEVAELLGKKQDYNRWYLPTGRQYTDGQFNALYNFVRADFKTLGAHALVLLGAEHLDTKAFGMLQKWYELRKRQFMIVLCFKLEKKAKHAEALRELYRAIPTGLLNDPIELPRLDRKEFADHIVKDILQALKIPEPETVEDQLALVKSYWSKTQGDWHSIELRAQDLKVAVARKGDSSRKLTPEILDAVFGK
jgi:hypothetical protein